VNLWVLAYTLTLLILAGGIIFFFATRSRRFILEGQKTQAQLKEVSQFAEKSSHRLETVFNLSKKFVETSDEKEIVDLVLRSVVDLTSAKGASFVPLDEHGQSLAAFTFSPVPFPISKDWLEYLASPLARESCSTCIEHGELSAACPLAKGPFSDGDELFCLPLMRGDLEYGVLNLYLPADEQIDLETQAFLRSIADEMALVLEGVHLRKRQFEMLQQLQMVRQKTDFSSLVSTLLDNVRQAMQADFAVLAIKKDKDVGMSGFSVLLNDLDAFICGDMPEPDKPFIDRTIQKVIASGEPLVLANLNKNGHSSMGVRCLIATPLFMQGQSPQGALLVGSHTEQNFHSYHLDLLQTIAGQITLVAQNSRQMAELEYQVMIGERTRLAREIHDGMAQTLGYVKLQMAQMQNYLERGEFERLHQMMKQSYAALSEAYQDARYAIDGLRISPGSEELAEWLRQTVLEFQEMVGPQGPVVYLKEGEIRTCIPA
jgi:two-component system nitrate/nitrite sensor histidine kinase NarX